MDTAEERLKDTLFVVAANNNEHLDLWRTFAEESPDRPSHVPKGHMWEQMNGWLITIGELDSRPVCISISWDKIDGQLIAFWEATSQVVDYAMIEEWFDKYFHGTWNHGRRAITDAMNFHQCLYAIEEVNKGV